MDCHKYITIVPERKRGEHLGREERGAIQQLKKQGCSLEQLPEKSTVRQARLCMSCAAVRRSAKAIEAVHHNTVPSEGWRYIRRIA